MSNLDLYQTKASAFVLARETCDQSDKRLLGWLAHIMTRAENIERWGNHGGAK